MRVRHNRRRAALAVLTLLSATGVSGCAAIKKAPGLNLMFPDDDPQAPQDPTAQAGVDYEISVRGLGAGENEAEAEENARIRGILEDNARIYKLQDKPPPSLPLLRRRAAADEELILRALRSEGYYEGEAEILVEGGADPIDGAEPEDAPPPVVEIRVRKGPRYAIARQAVDLDRDLPPDLRAEVARAAASQVGQPGRGANVVAAEQAALGALNRAGRPYAARGDRRAEANFDHDALDVRTRIDPGPHTVYGATAIGGEELVETDYIEGFITWEPGETLSRGALRDAQRALVGTRLFTAVTVDIPEAPPENLPEGRDYAAPVTITVEEGKHRSVSAGLSYSTTDGPGATASWEHRNFYGRNEQVRAELDLSLVSQSAEATFRKPRFMKPTRDLIGGARLYREETDAYDAIGGTASIGLEETFNRHLRGTLGLAADIAQTKENGVTRESYLFGVPASIAFDDTNDLLNPTEGNRLRLAVAPWGGVYDNEATEFLIGDLNGSIYIPFDRRKRFVLALRGRGAAIFAEDRSKVPPQQRLYSGGGGSVRGFANQLVGPLDAQSDPLGGLTAAEASAEMRIRFGDFGVVPFVDAGLVGSQFFGGYDKLRWGAGLGVRYYSPVGPIRVDVAVPITQRDGVDDDYQLYFSIGQAF